jgi:hypothetical protein
MKNPIKNGLFTTLELEKYLNHLEGKVIKKYNRFTASKAKGFGEVDFCNEKFVNSQETLLDHYKGVYSMYASFKKNENFNTGEVIMHEDSFSKYLNGTATSYKGAMEALENTFLPNTLDSVTDLYVDVIKDNYMKVELEGEYYFMSTI